MGCQSAKTLGVIGGGDALKIDHPRWEIGGLQLLPNLARRTKTWLAADSSPAQIEKENRAAATGADCNLVVAREPNREVPALPIDKPPIAKTAHYRHHRPSTEIGPAILGTAD
jgi:hypothetical protein